MKPIATCKFPIITYCYNSSIDTILLYTITYVLYYV